MDHGSGTLLAHPAQVALAELDASLDELAAANMWSLPDADLLELRVAQERTLARLQSRILATTREIDGRGTAVATGARQTSTIAPQALMMMNSDLVEQQTMAMAKRCSPCRPPGSHHRRL